MIIPSRTARYFSSLSIRQRLILGITLLHGLLMSFLVIDLVARQDDFLRHQSLENNSHLAETLAVSSTSWVMANDVVGLQEVTRSVARHPHVHYVMLLTPEGRLLTHSDPRHIGRHARDNVSRSLIGRSPQLAVLVNDHALMDIAAPVMAGNKLIAWARVGVDQAPINANLRAVQIQGVLYILFAVGLGYLFAMLMANWMTEGLNRLANAFQRVRADERGFRVDTQRHDEIGQLGDGFNLMLADLEAKETQLIELATTDFLTGLSNRRHFIERMEDQLARVQRNLDQPVSVLMLDLDHFKSVNDTHGHATGDAVLRHFACLIQDSLRKIDTAGRVGGEEFAILLPAADSGAALSFAERLRQTVATTPLIQNGHAIPVTVSIGIAEMLPADVSADATLNRADEALYLAKAGGRNRVEVAALIV